MGSVDRVPTQARLASGLVLSRSVWNWVSSSFLPPSSALGDINRAFIHSFIHPSIHSLIHSTSKRRAPTLAPAPRRVRRHPNGYGTSTATAQPQAWSVLCSTGQDADCGTTFSHTKRQHRWFSIWNGKGTTTESRGPEQTEAPWSQRSGCWGGSAPTSQAAWTQRLGPSLPHARYLARQPPWEPPRGKAK